MSVTEKNILMDLLESYEVLSKPSNKRIKLWPKITQKYNEMAPVKKTMHQLRKFWTNVKIKLRKQILSHGEGVIAKFPDHEIRVLSLMPTEELAEFPYLKSTIDSVKKKGRSGNNSDCDEAGEIMRNNSNSASEDDDLVVTEEENPLAVSTVDHSSMDEQISFSKDPFQIRHVRDTTKFSSTDYGDDKQTYTNSIYQEEHFYDLEEEDPSLEDTPDVHIPDIQITNSADFIANQDSSDIEVLPDSPITKRDLSKVDSSRLMKKSFSVVGSINAVESSATSELTDDPSIDPLFIDPLLDVEMDRRSTFESNSLFSVEEEPKTTKKHKEKLSGCDSFKWKTSSNSVQKPKAKRCNKPAKKNTAPQFNIVPAKTFESTKPIAMRNNKSNSKIKVSTDLFEIKSATHTTDNTNPFSSHVNLNNLQTTSYSPIDSSATVSQSFSDTDNYKLQTTSYSPIVSSATVSQSFSDTGNFNSPLIVANAPSYLFTSPGNGPNSAPTSAMLFPAYPINVPNSFTIGGVTPNVGTVASKLSKPLTPIASKADEYLNFSNIGTVAPKLSKPLTPIASKADEYLNFSNIGTVAPKLSKPLTPIASKVDEYLNFSNIGTVASNISKPPTLIAGKVDEYLNCSNIGTVASNISKNLTSKAGKADEYLNFSKEYIFNRMKMEQTKFEYKMENLAKERQCLEERHKAEMKVLQLKLKYVTSQYEDMLKRNQNK